MKHKVHEHKLSNGSQGLVIHVPGAEVVRIQALFNSGFAYCPPDKYELSHVVEHLMLSGSKQYPKPLQFKSEAEKNGAYLNAFTSIYFNGYVYECSAFEAPRILSMLADQLANPLFPDETFDTEVGTVREELSNLLNNYQSLAANELVTAMIPTISARYEDRISQLDGISNQDVKSFYQQTHSAANMRFFISGDFADGGKGVIEEFEKLLDGMKPGQRSEIVPELPQSLASPVLVRRDIQQLYYSLHIYLGDLSPQERAHAAVLCTLFTGGWTSWVLGEARSRGLAYGVYASHSRQPNMSLISYRYFVTPSNANALFQLIADGFEKARTGAFDLEDLEAAKTRQIGRVMMSNQTPADLVGWYDDVYNNEAKIRNIEEYVSLIKNTSKEDIIAMSQRMRVDIAHGLSLVGDIDEKMADTLYNILQPIWSH